MATETTEAPETTDQQQKQPWYCVVLLDDNKHSYAYVIELCRRVFRQDREQGLAHATEVDERGRTVLLRTTLEHAELKRDQVHAFGADPLIASSDGPMRATIEAEDAA